MQSSITQHGSNWVIVGHIDEFSDIKEAVDSVDKTYDLASYTSAKGSKQNYITTPHVIPYYNYTTPIKPPPTWDKVSKRIENIVLKHLVEHSLLPMTWNGIKIESAWVVNGEEGSFHTMHEHGNGCISAVIYTSTAEVQYEHQGAIYFALDSNPYSDLGAQNPRLLKLNPKPGNIVIFPGWILHGVYPQGPGLRQTLAMDLVAKSNA